MSAEGSGHRYPDDQPPPRKFVLVVSCVDYRLLDDLVRFLTHENLTNRYYHIAFAGTALCLVEGRVSGLTPQCGSSVCKSWRKTLKKHIELVIELTGGKLHDIYIVEHRDCGAYEKFLKKQYYPHGRPPLLKKERTDHAKFARALRKELERWFGKDLKNIEKRANVSDLHPPQIHCLLMGLRGEVERL